MWSIFVHRCVYIEVMPTASAWITGGMCINRMYAVLMIHPSVSVRNWVQLISLCDPEMDVMVEYLLWVLDTDNPSASCLNIYTIINMYAGL